MLSLASIPCGLLILFPPSLRLDFHYVPQADFELTIFLPQFPKW